MVNSSPALILILACSARVLLGKTEWAQLGTHEWDMKLNVGNTAWPPPFEQANAFVQRRPTARLMSLSFRLGSEDWRNVNKLISF